MKHFAVLISLLRDRPNFLDEVRHNIKIESKIASLLVASSTFFAVYGGIIGSSSGWLQTLSSAIKLPALYLITLAICLPTLYFFDILFGSSLSFGQYTLLSLTTVSVISVLLFSFAPITLFFLISIHDYNFFLLLNVAIFVLTGLVGIKLFYEGMLSITKSQPDRLALQDAESELLALKEATLPVAKPDDFLPLAEATRTPRKPEGLQKTRIKLLQLWLILYGLVGSQLGWTLRPFFGAPGEPFQFFRTIEGNFYAQVWRSFLTLMGVS